MLVKLYFFPHIDMAEVNLYNWDIVDTDWEPLTGLGDRFEKEQEQVNSLFLKYFADASVPQKEGTAKEKQREYLISYLRGDPIDFDCLDTDSDDAKELQAKYKDFVDCAFIALCFPLGIKLKTFEEEKEQFPMAADCAFNLFTETWKTHRGDEGKVTIEKKNCHSLAETKAALEQFFRGIGQRAKAVKVLTIGHGAAEGLFGMKDEEKPVPSKEITDNVVKMINSITSIQQVDVVLCQCYGCDNLPATTDNRMKVNALAKPEDPKVPIFGRYKWYDRKIITDQDGNRQFESATVPLLDEYMSEPRNLPRVRELRLDIEVEVTGKKTD